MEIKESKTQLINTLFQIVNSNNPLVSKELRDEAQSKLLKLVQSVKV